MKCHQPSTSSVRGAAVQYGQDRVEARAKRLLALQLGHRSVASTSQSCSGSSLLLSTVTFLFMVNFPPLRSRNGLMCTTPKTHKGYAVLIVPLGYHSVSSNVSTIRRTPTSLDMKTNARSNSSKQTLLCLCTGESGTLGFPEWRGDTPTLWCCSGLA